MTWFSPLAVVRCRSALGRDGAAVSKIMEAADVYDTTNGSSALYLVSLLGETPGSAVGLAAEWTVLESIARCKGTWGVVRYSC